MRRNRLLEPVMIIGTLSGCFIIWVYLCFGGHKSYLTSKHIHIGLDTYIREDLLGIGQDGLLAKKNHKHTSHSFEKQNKKIPIINDGKRDEVSGSNFDALTLYYKRKKFATVKGYLHNVDTDPDRSKIMRNIRTTQTRKKPNTTIIVEEFRTPTRDTNIIKVLKTLNELKVDADDPRLIDIIRKHFIDPPSTQPYNLDSLIQEDTSMGQAPLIDNRLKNKERGFFVESGAFDGETGSNTLFFEQTRSWTGILIEPNPLQYQKLINKHRKSYSINACLSKKRYPTKEVLYDKGQQSKVFSMNKTAKQMSGNKGAYQVQCLPLYSIMLALNQTCVDYLSLDVEGSEQEIIATIPWHRVNINMMTIEYNKWPGGARQLCKDMRKYSYECMVSLTGTNVADVVLRKKTRRRKQRTINVDKPAT